ncbi:MAG: hypothetical protein JO269_03375 [Burkholderiaceae bacterium]|nr:hypothetical protein [Burkholderiaceae bacterium]
MPPTSEQLARIFFDRYTESFSDLSGQCMARCYALPSVMTRADGSSYAFTDEETLLSALRWVMQDYVAQGGVAWRYEQLEVHGLGQNGMLASVTWIMLDQHAQILKQWRHSYVLVQSSDAGGASVKIVAAVYNR